MAIAENYPQLQTTGAFRDFQAHMKVWKTGSQLNVRFNEIVQVGTMHLYVYFQKVIIAKLFEFMIKAILNHKQVETAPDIKSMRIAKKINKI